jgi:hypothetical protein
MDYGPSYEKNIMYFKESNDFLTIENKKFINEKILSNFFPFYRNFTLTSSKDKNIFLSHVLLVRPEERINKNHINSSYFLETLKIILSFLDKFEIKHKEILRMSINYTYNNGVDKCPIHQDHKYSHKQIIIYLNDADPLSKTVILDEKNKILKEITPQKNKGICFDNKPHYHFYPKKGERIVLVTTFK